MPTDRSVAGDGSTWTGPSATEPPIQEGSRARVTEVSSHCCLLQQKWDQIPQDPTACLGRLSSRWSRSHRQAGCTRDVSRGRRLTGQCSTLEPCRGTNVLAQVLDQPDPTAERSSVLLRKEVIQPHLPVRLPCYDFVPIADPTFDSSLSCELGHWLRVLPTFVT